jgi:hypothetical protein
LKWCTCEHFEIRCVCGVSRVQMWSNPGPGQSRQPHPLLRSLSHQVLAGSMVQRAGYSRLNGPTCRLQPAGRMVQRAGRDRARRPDPPLPTRAGRALDLVTRRAADAAARPARVRPARVRPARVRPARVRMPPDSSPGRSCGPTRPGSCLTCSSPDHTTRPRSSPGSSGSPHAAPRSGCRSTRSRAAVTPPPRTRGCRSSPPSAPCSTRPLPGPTRPPESSQDR